MLSSKPHFNGPAYVPALDQRRLTNQIARIRDLMLDGRWRTLREIARATRDPEASVSAQLRHLRKERFGSYLVERRARSSRRIIGLFEYRVVRGTPGTPDLRPRCRQCSRILPKKDLPNPKNLPSKK
jgi:hypothetical protein